MEEKGDLKFVYDKRVATHIDGKVIEYRTTPAEGFSITAEDGPACAGDCSCE